ncbi:response regulator [Polaribacter sp.]|uniref:response regulator n=1 Tax=Polaribacter sp. TaxID=1920175 RepID=UPI0040478CCC
MSQIIVETSPINILVIEDNPGDFFLLEEYLSEVSTNINTNHCKNLEHAVSFLQENINEISVIFSDMNLPDANNMEVVNDLLNFSKSVPVILLSGHKNEKIVEKSKKMGVFDFLLKDELNPTLLKETIEMAIQKIAS